jgi:hypothetical protein
MGALLGLSWLSGAWRLLASPLVQGAIVVVLVIGWHAYFWSYAQSVERERLQVETLRATIAELQRQRAAAEGVADDERARAAARAKRIRELNERLAEHERDVEIEIEGDDGDRCRDRVDDAGRKRMLDLRRRP